MDSVFKLLEKFDKMTIDEMPPLFYSAKQNSNCDYVGFPFYNIINISPTEIRLELALAGFSKENIKIEREHNLLTVSGTVQKTESDKLKYKHRGITTTNFSRSFSLSDNAKITRTSLINGILSIDIESNKLEKTKQNIPIE